MNWYKLNDDHSVTKLPHGQYPEGKVSHVGDDTIDGQRVSTVFLSLDHNWEPDGEPVLFETMIFGGPYDQDMWRYKSWGEARQAHEIIVHCLKHGINPNEVI